MEALTAWEQRTQSLLESHFQSLKDDLELLLFSLMLPPAHTLRGTDPTVDSNNCAMPTLKTGETSEIPPNKSALNLWYCGSERPLDLFCELYVTAELETGEVPHNISSKQGDTAYAVMDTYYDHVVPLQEFTPESINSMKGYIPIGPETGEVRTLKSLPLTLNMPPRLKSGIG